MIGIAGSGASATAARGVPPSRRRRFGEPGEVDTSVAERRPGAPRGSIMKSPKSSSSVRSAGRRRRNGSAAAPTAVHGIRTSRNVRQRPTRQPRPDTRCQAARAPDSTRTSRSPRPNGSRLASGVRSRVWRWHRAWSLVLLGGEPGIGKSRCCCRQRQTSRGTSARPVQLG